MVPVRLFDARTLRKNEKMKISKNENKTWTIQPPLKSNDLHFKDVDRKLRDRSSESIVLQIKLNETSEQRESRNGASEIVR